MLKEIFKDSNIFTEIINIQTIQLAPEHEASYLFNINTGIHEKAVLPVPKQYNKAFESLHLSTSRERFYECFVECMLAYENQYSNDSLEYDQYVTLKYLIEHEANKRIQDISSFDQLRENITLSELVRFTFMKPNKQVAVRNNEHLYIELFASKEYRYSMLFSQYKASMKHSIKLMCNYNYNFTPKEILLHVDNYRPFVNEPTLLKNDENIILCDVKELQDEFFEFIGTRRSIALFRAGAIVYGTKKEHFNTMMIRRKAHFLTSFKELPNIAYTLFRRVSKRVINEKKLLNVQELTGALLSQIKKEQISKLDTISTKIQTYKSVIATIKELKSSNNSEVIEDILTPINTALDNEEIQYKEENELLQNIKKEAQEHLCVYFENIVNIANECLKREYKLIIEELY